MNLKMKLIEVLILWPKHLQTNHSDRRSMTYSYISKSERTTRDIYCETSANIAWCFISPATEGDSAIFLDLVIPQFSHTLVWPLTLVHKGLLSGHSSPLQRQHCSHESQSFYQKRTSKEIWSLVTWSRMLFKASKSSWGIAHPNNCMFPLILSAFVDFGITLVPLCSPHFSSTCPGVLLSFLDTCINGDSDEYSLVQLHHLVLMRNNRSRCFTVTTVGSCMRSRSLLEDPSGE